MALARTRELGGGSIAETTARQDRRGCRSTINRYIERSGEGYMDAGSPVSYREALYKGYRR